MEFGPLPQKRELPPFVHEQSAEDVALKLVRLRNELEDSHASELEAARKETDRLAEQLALLVHKKRASQDQEDPSKDRFMQSLRQLLKNEGIDLITYEGEEVTETLELETDIVEWLPPDDESADEKDRVVEALEPEIRRKGRLLHHAKLSCRQGTYASDQEVPATVEAEEGVRADVDEAPAKPQDGQVVETSEESAQQQKPHPNSRRARAKHAKRRKKRR